MCVHKNTPPEVSWVITLYQGHKKKKNKGKKKAADKRPKVQAEHWISYCHDFELDCWRKLHIQEIGYRERKREDKRGQQNPTSST